MKQTLTTSQAIDILMEDEYARWTYNGAKALIEYLEQYEEDMETPMEMDRVAIRCDFSEYDNALECAKEYGFEVEKEEGYEKDLEEDEIYTMALEWLQERTTAFNFEGGCIAQGF